MHARHISASGSLFFIVGLVAASGGCGLVLGLGDFKDEGGGATNSGGAGGDIPTSTGSTSSSNDACSGQGSATCACEPMTQAPCYSGPEITKKVGVCKEGVHTCNADGKGYGACTGEVVPKTEDCSNQVDDDCDGSACAAVEKKVILAGGSVDQQSGEGIHMAVAPSGDVYITGGFSSAIDFGAGPVVPVGMDVFLAKYDKDLNLQWAHRYGDGISQHADAIAVDPKGNVVIAGLFSGTLDFGGGISLTKTGASVFFVAKFDPTGAPIVARAIGNVPYTRCFDVAADSAGNVILSGAYAGSSSGPATIDFGNSVTVTSAGGVDTWVWDSFVTKLDSSTLLGKWARSFNDANADWTTFSIAIDPSDSVLLTGDFAGTINFVGSTAKTAGSRDAFALKLDASGNRLWFKQWGYPGKSQSITDIATDSTGDMVLVGRMDGSFDFPESGDSYPLYAGGVVLKYTTAGTYVYSQFFGTSFPSAVSSDKGNGILAAGWFSGLVDFGGGNLIHSGDSALFLTSRTPVGKHTWSKAFGDVDSYPQIASIGTSPAGDLYAAGTLSGSQLDFGDGKVGPGNFLIRLGH